MFTAKYLSAAYITITICVLGLIGNLFCALVLFSKRIRQGRYLYILQGLTMSDTFLLTLSLLRTLGNLQVLSLTSLEKWQIIFFWDWIATSSTKYYTVAISMERFIFVTFPLEASRYITLKKSKWIAVFVFLFCIGIACFSFAYQNWIDPTSFDLYVAIVLHFTPFSLVVIFNLMVFWALRAYKKERKGFLSRDSNQKEESSVNRMLLGVTVIFGVCYSFELIRRVMNYAWGEYMKTHQYYEYNINILADIFYVLNSSVNFIIYSLLGRNFRQVFIQVCRDICGKCCKRVDTINSNNSNQESTVTIASKSSSSSV